MTRKRTAKPPAKAGARAKARAPAGGGRRASGETKPRADGGRRASGETKPRADGGRRATAKQVFEARLRDDGSFEVPFDVRAAYGQARPAVKMTLCDETYRTRVMVYGGTYVLGIWKAVLARHGLAGGARLRVTLEPDTEERVVAPPPELARALAKDAAARAGWAASSFTHRREWAQAIAGAKRPETRARWLARAIAALAAKSAKAATTAMIAKPGGRGRRDR